MENKGFNEKVDKVEKCEKGPKIIKEFEDYIKTKKEYYTHCV